MGTRNTNTLTADSGGNNRTATHLSTNILIRAGGNTVGAIQELSVNENRSIQMIDEVGTDGHIDSAPNRSTDIGGRCRRIRYDRTRIAEAFSRGFVHAKSQRVPFDIEIQDIFADSDQNNAIITVIKNVWIESIDYAFNAQDFVITENMSFKAEDIYSIGPSGSNVARLVANGYQFPSYFNQFEREADRGKYSGALDAAGLLNAYLNDPA